MTADSLKRAVKGFWVPRTGVLSSHAFEKGTEWSRTDAELPVQAKLVVAYGRLRKEEADRRNRAHAAAATEAAPRGCTCVACVHVLAFNPTAGTSIVQCSWACLNALGIK